MYVNPCGIFLRGFLLFFSCVDFVENSGCVKNDCHGNRSIFYRPDKMSGRFFHAGKKSPKNYLRHILKYLRDNSKYV